MFKELKKYKNIVVTGPQRAGTRITATILAKDTGLEYVDEDEVAVSDFRLLEWNLSKGGVVVQCPGLCHKVHEIEQPDTLIVIVRRRIDQIVASQKRINWGENEKIELAKYGYTSGTISRIKYRYWEKRQKALIENSLEIEYDKLKDHPLFIEAAKRKDFEWNQTC